MPILARGYEAWTGKARPGGFRAWPIAWAALRRNLRWYTWCLYAVGLLAGSGAAGFIIFLAYGAISVIAADADPPAMIRVLVERPEFHLDILMVLQFFWALALATLIGAGEIGEDLRSGAVVFYLGRPISRLDYCLGKVMAVSIPVLAVTLLPTTILFTIQCLFQGTMRWFLDHARVLPAAAGLSLVLCVFASGLVLGTSALVRRRRWASVGVAALFLIFVATAGAVAPPADWSDEAERASSRLDDTDDPAEVARRMDQIRDRFDALSSPSRHAGWRFLSPNASLHAVGRDLMGLRVPSNFAGGRHWWFLLGIGGAGLLFVWRRVRAVEVVS
jgi:hypothetical protein